jgi:uncharacterized protein YndB with AHSA1/START domain
MATITTTPDLDAILGEIHIAAPPARVFEALTNNDQAVVWWTNPAFRTEVYEMDARVGGKWRLISVELQSPPTRGDGRYEHHGEVLEIDPPRLLVYTWLANFHENPSARTIVRWELSPQSGGTLLKLTHSGLANLPSARAAYTQGWPGVLQRIKDFCSTKVN